jgi:polar amino acid transport system substrate-binding protein
MRSGWRAGLRFCALVTAAFATACTTTDSGAPPVGTWAPLASATPYPGATAAPAGSACSDAAPPTDDVPPSTGGGPSADPVLDQIRRSGKLRVGVSRDAFGFGSWNVLDQRFEGFDVDVARQIALAVFPGPADRIDDHIVFHPLSFAERVGAIRDNSVDLVASTMTITCARRQDVGFSTPYYVAYPTFLSRTGVRTLDDLRGKTVCVVRTTTTLDKLNLLHKTHDFIGLAPPRQELSDCLVDFQGLKVDVVAANDATLRGMEIEDATVKIGPYKFPPIDAQGKTGGLQLQPEWYGLGMTKDGTHRAFRGFVNGVLERLRTDGTWRRLCSAWQSVATDCTAGVPPPPSYRRPAG